MQHNVSYKIELSEDNQLATLELLKVGSFDSRSHGKFTITKGMLREAKNNFDNNVHRLTDQDGNPMIPLNFSHEKDKEAAGWIKELELNDNDTVLIGKIDLTPIGREKVTNKEYAFASAEFSFLLNDPELNQDFKNVITGAALTNIPFMRGLKSIELTEQEFKMEEILKLINELTDEEKVILIEKLKSMIEPSEPEVETEEEVKATEDKDMSQSEVESKDSVELSESKDEIEKLKGEKESLAKELEFSNLLMEGKVVPAQKEAFINNDMKALIENAVDKNINLDQSSSESSEGKELPKEEKIETREEAENKVLELAERKVEEKSMDFAKACAEVLRENESLSKLINK
jgi:hypothetical protein